MSTEVFDTWSGAIDENNPVFEPELEMLKQNYDKIINEEFFEVDDEVAAALMKYVAALVQLAVPLRGDADARESLAHLEKVLRRSEAYLHHLIYDLSHHGHLSLAQSASRQSDRERGLLWLPEPWCGRNRGIP